MNKQTGPSFKIISSCEGCSHLTSNEHIKNSYLITEHRCNSLQKDLHGNSLTPLDDCPFKLSSEIEFLENTTRKLKEQEFQKLEKIITDIFSGFNFSIDEYSGEIYVKSESEISLGQFKEFEKRFPNYDLKIDSYDSDTVQIRISK
jgi:hypothetical protein